MREKLIRFMTGRNGADNLSRAVSFIVVALLVVGLFTDHEVSRVLWVFAVLGMVYVYFRIFSRNVYKRRTENQKYLRMTSGRLIHGVEQQDEKGHVVSESQARERAVTFVQGVA